jgi:hypothetical protein
MPPSESLLHVRDIITASSGEEGLRRAISCDAVQIILINAVILLRVDNNSDLARIVLKG